MRSAIEICLSLCRAANAVTVGPRITVPSSFISSARTPTGAKPASRHRSTQASVCPERISTPPSLATSGKTWPGRTKSDAPALPLASARTVLQRSSAEMPVVKPCRTSTETVKAVPSGASFAATMGSRCKRLASSGESGAHTMPEVWRMMKAIFSGVHIDAATKRSPSFSRSSSSVTTTIPPAANAASTASTRWWFPTTFGPLHSGTGERPCRRLAHLPALTQIVVGDDACHHGLADRHRANADTGVVPPLGADIGLGTIPVNRAARSEYRGCRLDCEPADDRLAGRDAAQNAARMVGKKHRSTIVAHADLVGVLLAAQRRRRKASADLDPFDGIDAHESRGEIAVELAVNRRAETNRHAFRDDLDDGAHGGTALADVVEIFFEEFRLLRIRTEERIALDLIPAPARALDLVLAHLDQRATDRHARHDFARDRAGGNTHGGLSRRLAAAAAIITNAVFGVVGVIGVPGPVLVLDVGIIFGTRVDVVDHERNRRPGRHLLAGRLIDEHAGENFHLVRLAPLGGEARLARPPLVEIGLDVGLGQRDAGWTTVDHATDRGPVAFAEGRDPEKMAEGVERHGVPSAAVW